MDMRELFDDFKQYVDRMTDEDIKKSIDDAIKHSANEESVMIMENDKFKIPDEYKDMTSEEIRREKDILYNKLKGENKMSYCCICGRNTRHKNSYHCMIADDIYHYCHRHSWIGKSLHKKIIRSMTK